MLKRYRRRDQVEGARANALTLAGQIFPQFRTAPGRGQGEWYNGHPGQKRVEARACPLRIGATQRPLVYFHVRDDRDGQTLRCQLLKQC